MNEKPFWEESRTHTCTECERSRAQEQEIDGLFFTLDIPADVVHSADQAGVCLDENVLAVGVQRLAFAYDAISGFLRAADEINAGLGNMLGELLQRHLADPARRTSKDGDKARREGGGDAGIGGLDFCEGHHLRCVNGGLRGKKR